MLRPDAMGDSSMAYDPDPAGVNCMDNLSISLESFNKILDEDPDPRQSHPSGTPSGLHQCKLAPGQVNFGNVFQHQSDWLGLLESEPVMEELRELGSSQWDSSNFTEPSDCKKEICLELLFGSEGTANNLSDIYHTSRIDNGNLHALQHTDSDKFSSLPPNHSPDWLRLASSIDNTCLMDSVEGSFDGLNSSNFYHQQLQNNMPKCNASPESAEGAHFYTPYKDIVNGLYLDSGQEKDFVRRGGEISFQMGVKESILDVDNNSALFIRQNRGIDSSHIFSMEKSDLSDRMKLNMNTTSVLDSTAQEGNKCAALSMSPSMDPDTMLPDTIHAEVNTSEATDIVCNGAESCFTLLRDSATDAENSSMQIFPSQFFQPFLSPEKGAMIYRMNEADNPQLLIPNTCMINDAKLRTQEESLDNSVPEDSVIDSESFSIDLLCAERKHCEDANSNSESSTDSSPVLSTRNSTADDIDKSMVNTAKPLVPNSNIVFPNKKQKTLSKDKREDQIPASRHKHHDVPKGGYAAVQRNPLRSSLSADDDEDICVLDDISDPVHSSSPSVHMKLHPMSHYSGFSDPRYHGSGDMRLNAYDERLTLRTALQDLSQPKSEANPPDGVLAVPLLRHQRIALSWMVQKEKNSLNCSGGILADDQGLGKTISTIALILMERSPSSRYCSMTEKPDKLEALNLDDDDDVSGVNVVKQPPDSTSVLTNSSIKRENSVMVVKGRPAAGTLVVCPTSVLRQWGDELQSKVTSKANLSFLVYHGSNRTKDPNELAKYDVVLTTYAIVSMEVPKQPLVDKDDEETRTADVSGVPSGLLNSKKRKKSPSLSTKNQTNRTKVDSTLLESAARPLARVGWFRVILDEAQSIKNHRTQVARACWGLRAKRRWCLSGTPIQNAIDDLYSYFRFLRYDPYAVYKSFCTTIKGPISRNPTHGYKKLQLVLKTIMLRRTKGTQIDGKPIITLPPKTITLKKVEFSKEERAFYSTLEDESREQFMEYAAAGTVKQNYVNILLMLLRLRQACDHPLLVRGYDSNSTGSSSMEMAKKFPRDKLINLLSCLEACLAICTICNDPPEDAVVTICGHVFCKQCICEHLTGDDNVCPSANCKVRLSVASVFSRGTLKSCLSGLPDHHSSCGSSVPCMVNTSKIEDSVSSDSSKINAALEILQSLPRSQCSSSQIDLEKSNGGCTGFLENAVNTVPAKRSMDLVIRDRKYADSEKSSNAQATEKAIVFSQWTRMLDLLEIPLKDSCIQYRRLDGTMSVASRDKAVKDFNTLPEITVMIMSLKAASLGLNMVAASHVLLLDLWWNPTTEDQAIDRAHRIGQTRPVTVSRLTVKDTVEDRILALQQKKREMVSSAFGEDESGSRQTRLTVDDLKYLFMA